MIDLLRRRGMIPAIMLACAVVTVITWAALATIGQPPPRATPSGGPTIHAYLLPAIAPARPARPAAPRRPASQHRPGHRAGH
jgi:hypothetical protein